LLSPRFARRLICIQFWGQKRIGGFAKYGSSRCFSSDSFTVLSVAAPPPFRIFAGGFFRRNAFGLSSEYCTSQGRRARRHEESVALKTLEVQVLSSAQSSIEHLLFEI